MTSPLTVRNGSAAISVAEVERSHDEWLKVSSEVARLKEYYEPGIVIVSAKAFFPREEEGKSESGSGKSVVLRSEEDMQRLEAAKERLRHAQEAQQQRI